MSTVSWIFGTMSPSRSSRVTLNVSALTPSNAGSSADSSNTTSLASERAMRTRLPAPSGPAQLVVVEQLRGASAEVGASFARIIETALRATVRSMSLPPRWLSPS